MHLTFLIKRTVTSNNQYANICHQVLSTTPAKNYAIGDSLVKSLHIFFGALFKIQYHMHVVLFTNKPWSWEIKI